MTSDSLVGRWSDIVNPYTTGPLALGTTPGEGVKNLRFLEDFYRVEPSKRNSTFYEIRLFEDILTTYALC